jgi:hypothetical protein
VRPDQLAAGAEAPNRDGTRGRPDLLGMENTGNRAELNGSLRYSRMSLGGQEQEPSPDCQVSTAVVRGGSPDVGNWHDSEATVAGRWVRFLGYSGRVLAKPSAPPLALGCRAGMTAFTGSLGG